MMLLDFNWPEEMNDASFVLAACNSYAYKWLQNMNTWPTNHTLLTGPAYSGKTHLAHIWSRSNKAVFIRQTNDELLNQDAAYVIDSLDRIRDEEYLMRFFYQIDKPVLWIARESFCLDDIQLPDLKTRLSATIPISVFEPDEETFKSILKKRCRDFGMWITPDTLEYIVKRVDITYEALQHFVDQLHYECLVQQKAPSTMIANIVIERGYSSFA